jgi:fructokinase
MAVVAVVVGLGELLWDLFADGKTLGGAPANFAFHAAQLGHEAFVASRVGRDALGRQMLDELAQRQLDASAVQLDDSHPTGTVPVQVGSDGTATFSIVPDVAWDYLEDAPALHDLVRRADLVCVGTLAQRGEQTRQAIQRLLGSCQRTVLFDANLRHRLWSADLVEACLSHTSIAKVNEREWSRLVELRLVPTGVDPIGGGRALIRRFDLDLVCITRGSTGCLLVSANDAADHPGFPATVVDTVGCGDAFAAAIAHGWLTGQTLDEMARSANRLGAWVASHRGATPTHPPA